MELGEKLRQARLDAGLSQRQLCEGVVTRNMLSLIEHGTAKPSMDTLRLLSARLGKPVSYFLEEDAVMSPNSEVMEASRRCFDDGKYDAAYRLLEEYRGPDPVYDREEELLRALTLLELARKALEEGRQPYARELLEQAQIPAVYCAEEIRRKKLLLLGKATGARVAALLPSLDEELLLRAREAFQDGDTQRAAHLLEAAQDHTDPEWNLLRGRVWMAEQEFRAGARCLHMAENAYPKETAPLLERCYREMEDYRRAYEYACKGR